MVDEQVVLITGATDGLGRAAARQLAGRGAAVLLHGRRREKAASVAKDIGLETGNERVEPVVADLASLDQVRGLADEIAHRAARLDVLVNNAGIISPRRELSRDGYELTFAVNYLSHFLLTRRLLPLLHTSAPARIVNVSSIGQSPIDFGDVMLERSYDDFSAYAQSKIAQVMFTFELAERLRAEGEEGVTVNALHPATLMDTKMVRETFGRARSSVAEGVQAVTHLAVSPKLEGMTGRYFDGRREAAADPQAYDPLARRRLWELSEELVGE